ncbi:MAG: AAA family ATPase, partial [Methanospirillum sp.]|nr:AAA family ATPase [Methanospirillum sp.]
MKIISLHLKNLNSLVGDWSIDFSEPSYADYGFFAITGPTGAGKSTILDGICLALYGKTPRLKRISDSTNDIMSTNTGECLAEVVFTTEKGKFRSRWYQKRAYSRPDGKLQTPVRELSHADTSQLIETKIKEIETLVEEYTGMDFERFTRTMLLAQGGFTAFLLAPVQDRANILEEIT